MLYGKMHGCSRSIFVGFLCCCISFNVFAVMSNEPIKPIPQTIELNEKKVSLGRLLFSDVRLSKDNSVSCESCHNLSAGGDDGLPVSLGIMGRKGGINSPTVYNSGYNFKQFWNGRAESLFDQVDGPVQAENEMGAIWSGVISRLYEDKHYPDLFRQAFSKEVSRETIKLALAEFEKSLITPNSRFDQYLRGDLKAITSLELQGYENFKRYGCVSCHQGVNVGGNMFQVFGVINNYFEERGGEITDADKGRYIETGRVEDRHMFKVPSLRMVAHTAPYLHDGSAKTLREAVDVMFRYQLGREAPDADKDAIVAFLKTLAGENTYLKL